MVFPLMHDDSVDQRQEAHLPENEDHDAGEDLVVVAQQGRKGSSTVFYETVRHFVCFFFFCGAFGMLAGVPGQ